MWLGPNKLHVVHRYRILSAILALTFPTPASAVTPNVVIIFMDDLGGHDVG